VCVCVSEEEMGVMFMCAHAYDVVTCGDTAKKCASRSLTGWPPLIYDFMRRRELHTGNLSKNTHLQVRLPWKKCENTFPHPKKCGNAVPTRCRATAPLVV